MTDSPSKTAEIGTVKAAVDKIGSRLNANLLRPIREFRLTYLPLVTVYFAYGALGLIDVSRDVWIKERLTLSPAELAGIAVWLSLPWTTKMVFGELVDSVPIFGSQRRSYVVLGALTTACGLLVLAGTAGG
jgi:BT1 family